MKNKTALSALLLWLIFAGFLAAVQFSTPNLADHDGYYHIKMAFLMRTEGLKPDFPWLPLSVLNPREFVDHHFLYHIALIPFTFGDLRLGAKLSAVVFPATSFLAIWWLLRGQRLPWAGLWSLGLLVVSEAFLYRMSLPRAQALSLGVLAMSLHWLLTGHPRRNLLLAFFYVWLYNAFPLIILVSLAWSVSAWWMEGKIDWKPTAYASLGVLLGLLINPYFPDNLIFALRHMLPKLTEPLSTSVGSEWYPYTTVQLLENSPLALLVFLIGVLGLAMSARRAASSTVTAFALACGFGLMLFQSRRFIEYFPAFSLIFAALAVKQGLTGWLAGEDSPSGPARLLGRLQGSFESFGGRAVSRKIILAGVMILILIPSLLWNLHLTRTRFADSTRPYQTYADASAWLIDNAKPGERIFQTDWDDFPRLFFYNTRNTYTLGLDPTYMQLYNPDLYDLWVLITDGEVSELAEVIPAQFGSNLILTDLRHKDFIHQADADPGLQRVYEDQFAIIYQIEANSP